MYNNQNNLNLTINYCFFFKKKKHVVLLFFDELVDLTYIDRKLGMFLAQLES